ncbi:helix-turn-helix domain-containing protein [Actinocorallia longicatena]
MSALRADMFDELCPSTVSPVKVGDKWGALVVRCLEGGPRRFSELRVPLARVTPKVLTQSLRTLERDGLVERSVEGRRVTYALTPLGRSLLGPLSVLCAWAEEHWDELVDAREEGLAAQGL